MTRNTIPILGVFALLLLQGCATAPESYPKPAPQPEAQSVIKPSGTAQPQAEEAQQFVDTGIDWVTNVSELKSAHRFRLAEHLVEINSSTNYHDGSAADIALGTRLRAVGMSRDNVIVADDIYIERSARVVPEQPPSKTMAPAPRAGQREKPAVPAKKAAEAGAPAGPSPSAAPTKVVKAHPKPVAPERTVSSKNKAMKAAASATKSAAESKQATAKASQPAAAQSTAAQKGEEANATVPVVKPEATSKQAKATTSAQKSTAVPKIAKVEQAPQPPQSGVAPSGSEKAAPPGSSAAGKDYSKLTYDERTLPMSLDHGWMLDRQPDLVDGTPRCILLSPEFPIFDGYYPAKAWLRVDPMRAWVKTDSNIDPSYPGQGLRVDEGSLVPFAAHPADRETVYTDASVVRSMAKGRTLTVAIGFWPTWPKTRTQTASISLEGFANAYAALQACSQQQQAARE